MLEFVRSFLEILEEREDGASAQMKNYISGAREIITRLSED